MEREEYACRWEELSLESECDPDEGGRPVVLCHHPESTGFCDYSEMEGDAPARGCPLFQFAVPLHEVEIRQHLEMVAQDQPEGEA